MATIVYIDGFNLYYGALKDTPYRWLNLDALCRRVLPRDDIACIRYFTALVAERPGDPQQPQRQLTYLRALETFPNIEIHYGHFLAHKVRMPVTKPRLLGTKTVEVIKTEEKGSDVNLASYLLLDAFQRKCDTAIVISNDSDLKTPIEIAERELGVKVGIVNPHPSARRSRALGATFFKQLRKSALAKSQLPNTVEDAKGEVRKPKTW